MTKCCLVLDNNAEHISTLEALCRRVGIEVVTASSRKQARTTVARFDISVAFIELNIEEPGGGLELLEDGTLDGIEAMLMAQKDDPQLANTAIQKGASYFFCKPVNDELIAPILSDIAAELEPETTDATDGQPCAVDQFGYLRGSSKLMRKLFRLVRKVAPSDASLLIVGESGTGKELVAQTVHAMSDRAQKPLIAFNSAAVAETLAESELFGHEKGSFSGANSMHRGFFERADGGTLFLDEITEMDVNLQAKLLRVLETKKIRRIGSEKDIAIDVRILSATNRSPEEAVREGKLREDLYYRLAQFPVFLPPLRTREGDIGGLAQHFLNTLNEEHETDIVFSAQALRTMRARDWPGNVRELKNYVERAYILSETTIETAVLPDNELGLCTRPAPHKSDDVVAVSIGSKLEHMERKLIEATLERNSGDKKTTSLELGVSLKTLYNKLNSYEETSQDKPVSKSPAVPQSSVSVEDEAPSQCETLPKQ